MKDFKFGLATFAAAFGIVVNAAAQELRENSVANLMEFAWSLTPAKFTKPNGKVVSIDKKKKEEVLVPLDVAREVIKVARLSAHAEVCNLRDEQITNYRLLMHREEDKKRWSPQQLIYISQLHLVTVMMLTGKLKLVEKNSEGKEVVVEKLPSNVAEICSDEQRASLKGMIAALEKASREGSAISAQPNVPADTNPPRKK